MLQSNRLTKLENFPTDDTCCRGKRTHLRASLCISVKASQGLVRNQREAVLFDGSLKLKENEMKEIKCPKCKETLADKSVKVCPKCGKKISRNGCMTIFYIFLGLGILAAIFGEEEKPQDKSANSEETASVVETESKNGEVKTPSFMDKIKSIVSMEKGVVKSLSQGSFFHPDGNDGMREVPRFNGIVQCENNDNVVDVICHRIARAKKEANDTTNGVQIIFQEKDTGRKLVVGTISPNGEIAMSQQNPTYNTRKKRWMESQFSAWDGSHKALEGLIKKSMNDEDSYKHHETTYIEVKDKEIQAKMQEVVKASGQNYKVDIDDIVITCVFSGKNAYGGRVKNTAYGLSKYKEGKVYLLTVE